MIQTEMFYLDTKITENKEQIVQQSPCVPCPFSKVDLAKPELPIANISHLEHFFTRDSRDRGVIRK